MKFRVLHICAVALAVVIFVGRYAFLPGRHSASVPARPQPTEPVAPPYVPATPAPITPHDATAPPVMMATQATVVADASLVRNGDFSAGLAEWTPWLDARTLTQSIAVVPLKYARAGNTLRIANPTRGYVGVQQVVAVASGCIYRLSGTARSTAVATPPGIFGGRIILFFSAEREHTILWLFEDTNWWEQSLVITNNESASAVLTVNLGYGSVAVTGEFTAIRLERLP